MRKWAEEVATGSEIDEQTGALTGFVGGEEDRHDAPAPGIGI